MPTPVCAVLADGMVQCWGNGDSGRLGHGSSPETQNRPVLVSNIDTATQIDAEELHTCALLGDGAVECWGLNGEGQLGNDTMTNSNIPVSVSGL